MAERQLVSEAQRREHRRQHRLRGPLVAERTRVEPVRAEHPVGVGDEVRPDDAGQRDGVRALSDDGVPLRGGQLPRRQSAQAAQRPIPWWLWLAWIAAIAAVVAAFRFVY